MNKAVCLCKSERLNINFSKNILFQIFQNISRENKGKKSRWADADSAGSIWLPSFFQKSCILEINSNGIDTKFYFDLHCYGGSLSEKFLWRKKNTYFLFKVVKENIRMDA